MSGASTSKTAPRRKRNSPKPKRSRPLARVNVFEDRKRASDLGLDSSTRRRNAQALIRAGALVTVGTDNYWAAASELSRTSKPENQDHGIGTIIGIEGLVELGMTPSQALVAATKSGAIASRILAESGTIEAGKRADILVLDADPLGDIHNIRKIGVLMNDGRIIDRTSLPQKRVLSSAASESRH